MDDPTNASYSYSDVLQITKNVSSGLVKHSNIKKGDILAICLPNSPEHVFSQLGAMVTGAIPTMYNPALSNCMYRLNT